MLDQYHESFLQTSEFIDKDLVGAFGCKIQLCSLQHRKIHSTVNVLQHRKKRKMDYHCICAEGKEAIEVQLAMRTAL